MLLLKICPGFRAFFLLVFFFERTRPAASMSPPCLIYLSTCNEARPRERSNRGRSLPIGKQASSYRGSYRVPLFDSSACLCVSVCVIFVVFTDCESCTRPISTNPGSMEVSEYGPTGGTFFVARRLELVTVTGLLCISWCVLGTADFFVIAFFRFFVSFKRTRRAASMRLPCLINLSTSTGVLTGCN